MIFVISNTDWLPLQEWDLRAARDFFIRLSFKYGENPDPVDLKNQNKACLNPIYLISKLIIFIFLIYIISSNTDCLPLQELDILAARNLLTHIREKYGLKLDHLLTYWQVYISFPFWVPTNLHSFAFFFYLPWLWFYSKVLKTYLMKKKDKLGEEAARRVLQFSYGLFTGFM